MRFVIVAKKKYYAWILPDGQSGICETWDECEKLCRGVSGEKHKGFATYDEEFCLSKYHDPRN